MKLNSICLDCITKGCNGTTCQVWTACIYKRVKKNDVEKINKKEIEKINIKRV